MTINCKGKLVDLSTPKIMGILNVTPDSFYDGGAFKNAVAILRQVEKMVLKGATFIDLGGYSSRPGAEHVTEEEELNRIVPILGLILKEHPELLLSIDTFRSAVADECLLAGAAMINDIATGNLDPLMFDVVAKHQAPYIMMHMKGTPQNMVKLNDYNDLIQDIKFYFSEKIAFARSKKINDLIIDPGFGFAKSISQNFQLLGHLNLFQSFDLPILAGLSRKSMVYKTLQTDPANALNGTTALHMIALQQGTKIIRAHDVKEAMECVVLYNALNAAANSD